MNLEASQTTRQKYHFMLRTLTEILDFLLEVLLPEVIFLVIKDIFIILFEETKQLDGRIAYDRRTL